MYEGMIGFIIGMFAMWYTLRESGYCSPHCNCKKKDEYPIY